MRLSIKTRTNNVVYLDTKNICIELSIKDKRITISDNYYIYIDEDFITDISFKWFLEMTKYYFDRDDKFKEIKIDLKNNGFRLIKHDDSYLEKIIITKDGLANVKVTIEGNVFIRSLYNEIDRLNKIDIYNI